MITINEERSGSTLVVCPTGRLDSMTAADLDAFLSAALDQESDIVIDMVDMGYVSSAGLRIFLLAAKKVKGKGGTMTLCGLQPSIREVFEISGFLSILNVVATREDALAEVGK